MLLAHSQNKAGKVQSYADHIRGVRDGVWEYAQTLFRCSKIGKYITKVALKSSLLHDLGKLHEDNQKVLREPTGTRLPFPHSDAGTVPLLREKTPVGRDSALLAKSHHSGLPNFSRILPEMFLRDTSEFRDTTVKDVSNSMYNTWLALHKHEEPSPFIDQDKVYRVKDISKCTSLGYRMGLSCLVDADHTDTAVHYESVVAPSQSIQLNPTRRLTRLNTYVSKLWNKCDKKKEVNRLRNDLYNYTSSQGPYDARLVNCDHAVGNGKTTSIAAHLLNVASDLNLRRIFIVLPFTNIIDQCVKVYREALVLPGEDPEEVVVAHHHRVEFDYTCPEGIYNMTYTRLWRAPIIVVTAVQFFETLTSNRPGKLRKLHELARSGIFFDECQSMLPVELLPLGYQLIRELTENWGCYAVMGSGTQTEFWKMLMFADQKKDIPTISTKKLTLRSVKKERRRIKYVWIKRKFTSVEDLRNKILSKKGPRLVVMNTVKNAALLAAYMKGKGDPVEHLSSSLKDEDKILTIKNIETRFTKKDTDWTLVATSVIEAGMDFSFRVGFREENSPMSILQTGGRVNRNCEYPTSILYIISVDIGNPENSNFRSWIDLSRDMFFNRKWGFSLTKKDIVRAFRRANEGGLPWDENEFVKLERGYQFEALNESFNVISNEGNVLAINDRNEFLYIRTRLRNNEKIPWADVHKKCFRVSLNKTNKELLEGIRTDDFDCAIEALIPEEESEKHRDQLYWWGGGYDNFIGYLAQYFGHYYNGQLPPDSVIV